MKNLSHYISNSNLNLSQLSQKTGISEERLNNLRADKSKATYAELRSISQVFDLPISHLLQDHQEKSKYEVLFRKQLGSTADDIVINNFNYFVDNVFKINPDVSKVEKFRESIAQTENTFGNAEKLAFLFREIYFDNNHFDPLLDLPQLLSNRLNFIVKVKELGKKTDGASASINGLIFLLISPRFEPRMLFTLAHELAHILNHHYEGDFVFFDNEISLRPKDDKNKIEGFANAFASALLLPQEGVAKMIQKIREVYQIKPESGLSDIEILHLSRFYGVSFDVAAYRCELLKLIPSGGAYSLSQKIKEDFVSAEKRADLIGVPARASIFFPSIPNFILDQAIRLIEDGKFSIGKIAEMLSISINAITEYHSKIG
jgi:Zn-dependent peptidase ImmA (M78 family)